MVLAALAVMAFVAQRFAQRNDELRRNALDFTQYVKARAATVGAVSTTLYWMATRPLLPAGRGTALAQLRQDDRRYQMPDGTVVQVQDGRALISLNAADRRVLLALLAQDGVPIPRAQAMIDVLDDYIDTDQLKRLNGAEANDYRRLGLSSPRNDWLLSVMELKAMPLWRDEPERIARLSALLGIQLDNRMNPVTAPPAMLRAMLPTANPAQLDLVLNLRRLDQLPDGRTAQRLTGLPFDGDEFIFAPGFDSRVTVWAPGLPRALEYNARLTPAGELGPWVITQQHSTTRPTFPNEAPQALAFPLYLAAPPGAAAARSPPP
jgi:hypothetical protein